MHVLGLVFNIALQVLRIPLRLTAAELLLEASYPINFVVKHPNPLLSPKRASPEAVETCQRSKTARCAIGSRPASRLKSLQKRRLRLRSGRSEYRFGGADRDRTGDPLLAKQVLSQLSYSPTEGAAKMVGLGRVELPTSPLSGVRSNQLSYRPALRAPPPIKPAARPNLIQC